MLVSVEDLSKYMDLKFSPAAQVGVGFVLEGLQSELEATLARPIEIGTYNEKMYVRPVSTAISGLYDYGYPTITYDPNGTDPITIPLNNSPVSSIVSIKASSTGSANPTETTLTENIDYVQRAFGFDLFFVISNFDTLNVTYRAGLNGPELKFFKLLILRAASREAQNLHDDNRGIQDLEAKGAAIQQTGFTEQELRSVKSYIRKRI